MPSRDHSIRRFAPHLPFALMAALLVLIWFSGGASRADVAGQVIARASAWSILIAFILFAPPPRLRPVMPVALFVLGSIVLVALQLVPLPPSVWTALPGRDLLVRAATVSGQDQPWRPLSISPGGTVNALSSLVVPAAALLLMAALNAREQRRVAYLLLGLVAASAIIGLLQFSGGHFDHPLVNDVPRSVSASFANRNHFALFAAIGCLLAPAWAFREGSGGRWKKPLGIALLLLFLLIILATGSRSGMVVGALGACAGVFAVRGQIGSELRRLPRPVARAVLPAGIGLVIVFIVLSVVLGRAVSLDRALSMEAAEDLRWEALPTVWAMVQFYFPFGTGVGTFDPAYRIHEPDALLSPAYFNHAHNDWLEIMLDAGLPGLLLFAAALSWWLWKSIAAWRGDRSHLLPRIGSATLLLVLLASITDYPARTPMIMTIVVIAAVWLNRAGKPDGERTGSYSRQ